MKIDIETLIEVLDESHRRHGEKPLTALHLSNILKLTIKNQDKKNTIMEEVESLNHKELIESIAGSPGSW